MLHQSNFPSRLWKLGQQKHRARASRLMAHDRRALRLLLALLLLIHFEDNNFVFT